MYQNDPVQILLDVRRNKGTEVIMEESSKAQNTTR
jgi:hypothetical protein